MGRRKKKLVKKAPRKRTIKKAILPAVGAGSNLLRGDPPWFKKLAASRQQCIVETIRINPKSSTERLRKRLFLTRHTRLRAFRNFVKTVLGQDRDKRAKRTEGVTNIDDVIRAAIPQLHDIVLDDGEKAYARVGAIRAALELRKSENDKERAGLDLERVRLEVELKRVQNREAVAEIERRLDRAEKRGKGGGLSRAKVAAIMDDVLMGRGNKRTG